MEAENNNNGGSEQASTSEDGQFLVAFRRIMKKEIEVLVIRTVEQMIVPIIRELVRKVVKEEIQSVEKRLLARNANEVTTPKERQLQLKFSEEVSDPVLTGKPLKGKGGDLKVEVVDRATGRVVEDGPISSAKVEILVLDASRDDNWTLENFNSRITREGDKKRPHFSKNMYIDVKKGVGFLSDVKLGHDSRWMKKCKCRLGARIVESFEGDSVQEGKTGSFIVKDCRSHQYKKHYPPSPCDPIWRLDNIGRDGDRCKRLNKENIKTVGHFLFMLSVYPQKLEKLVRAGAKWKATVDHALTCPKDDKLYLHYPSSSTSNESKMGVIFDAVGGLKGIIKDSNYVPTNGLSADEKDGMHELFVSAFENREARTCFDDEASLMKQFPYNPPTNSSIQEAGSNGNGVEPGQDVYIPRLDSPILDAPTQFPSCSSQCNITAFGNPNDMPHFGPLLSPLDEFYSVQSQSYDCNYVDPFIDIWNQGSDNLCEIPRRRGRFVTVAQATVWVLRAKKSVIMSLGDIHAHKKQKTN